MRPIWLLAASYLMYAIIDVRFPLVLIAVTLISFSSAQMIANLKTEKLKVFSLRIGIISLLVILFASKYLGFFISNVNSFLSFGGMNFAVPNLEWIFPVGISFFTFQAISYLVDVYNAKIQPEGNIIFFSLYLAFFPQLLIGPIERADVLIPDLKATEKINYEEFINSLVRILWGIWKKIMVANRLAVVASTVLNSPADLFAIKKILAVIALSFQIYIDFSAYCDMAIGAAGLFGIKLSENFDFPYFSESITDFWRRWHITLSNFLQDYIFLPLSFRHRRKKNRKLWTALDIITTFLISGIWHGANWTFVVWGLLHGIIQAAEYLLSDELNKRQAKLNNEQETFANKLLRTLLTFSLVSILWIFFTASSLADASDIIMSILTLDGITAASAWNLADGSLGLDGKDFFVALMALVFVMFVELKQYKKIDFFASVYKQPVWFRWASYLALIFLIIIFGYYGEAIHQEFIYFNF